MFSNDKSVCTQCGKLLPNTSFYKSNSRFNSGTGHLPICKSCIAEDYKTFKMEYMGSSEVAMQRICMITDTYFDPDLFESCESSDDKMVGAYIKKTNLGQYKDKSFSDTLDSGFYFKDSSARLNAREFEKEADENVDPKLIQKWGIGLLPTDYDALEAHYKYLKSANPNCDSNQEIFIIDLCYIKVKQMQSYREGKIDDYKILTEQYRKTFKEAQLKMAQDMSTVNNDSWGEWIEKISQYTPEEYYRNKKLYRDFDGLGDYINRFLYRPLRNLMHGTTERDNEFFVPSESDTDGYTDD